jgi:hypothetical protein
MHARNSLMRKIRSCGWICLLFLSCSISAQEINKHVSYTSIYDFLDELANIQIIELNSAVKPYSRKFISQKLKEAEAKYEKLNSRQKKDLSFFLKDYNKEVFANKNFKRRLDLFYYRDSLFALTINPILGYSACANTNGEATHRWNGGELYGYAGNNLAFYFSLRDNGVTNVLAADSFLTPLPGANYKPYQGTSAQRTDFDEARGSVSCGWKWGSVSLMKDNFVWGNNYSGANIFSGRQPSFAYLQFKMSPVKWFDFNYVHGWLVSEVLDSSRIYGAGSGLRKNFIPKFLAANLFTFKPYKGIGVSFGNSIIYADKYVQPVYLIPFMFYKSGDRTMNGAGSNSLGENSQMFGDISLRIIPKTHIYGSLFIDEINLGKMFDKQLHTNLYSLKTGIRISNLIKNTVFTLEYTRTNPWAYVHPIYSTTFESNRYNLGHYMGQNSDEIYAALRIRPVRGLSIDLSYTSAIKGPVQNFTQQNGVNNTAGAVYIKTISYQSDATALKITYEIVNDVFISAEYISRSVDGVDMNKYTPVFYQGSTQTFGFSLNAGF